MKTNVLPLLMLLAILLALGACSDESSTDPTNTGSAIPVPQALKINLFAASNEIAPSFEESVAKEEEEWTWGNHMYGLFNKFRVYDHAIHEGLIDGSNFFKAIYGMEEELGEMFEYAEAIEETVVEEPFEFGNSYLYDYAANVDFSEGEDGNDKSSFAYRIDGDTINFLVAYTYNEEEDKVTMGQLQGDYNPVSGDLELAMVYLVDYGFEQYTVRNEISGNTETHEFALRMATSGSYGLDTSVAGKGVSDGEGAHFLIKMNVVGEMGDDLGERYFVFTSDADEAYLQAMDPNGLAYADLPATVADYSADVQNMELFVAESLPSSLSEFNGGDISFVY